MLPQDRRATKPRKRDKKERTKKGDERRKNGLAQRVKPSNPTLAIDALIGEEEQSFVKGFGHVKRMINRKLSYTRSRNG